MAHSLLILPHRGPVLSRVLLTFTGLLAAAQTALAAGVLEACVNYGEAELVFVGRARPPIHYLFAPHAALDSAKRELAEAEQALEQYRSAIGDPQAHARDSYGRLHAAVRSDREAELLGRVIDALDNVDFAKLETPKPQDYVVTPIDVEIRFRGEPKSVMLLSFPELTAGKSYLIYGEYLFRGLSDVIIGSRTDRPLDVESATEELRYLSSAATSPDTTILGTLRFRTPGSEKDRPPLAGIAIRASSEDWSAETTTIADGSYRFDDVPPGHVSLDARFSTPLTIGKAGSGVREARGGCLGWDLEAVINGYLSGHVLWPDGRPLAHALIKLLPVDPKQADAGPGRDLVVTDDAGKFDFRDLPPGSYLLRLDPQSALTPPQGFGYTTMFFPGTTDRALAQPIAIGLGSRLEGVDFQVSDPLPLGRLEVLLDSLVHQSDVYLCVRDSAGEASDPLLFGDRPAVYGVLQGETYFIDIHANTPSGTIHSGFVKILGVAGPAFVTLKPDPETAHPNGWDCSR